MAFDNAEAVETDAIAFWKETRCADIGNSPDNIALPTDVRNLTFFLKIECFGCPILKSSIHWRQLSTS